MSKYEYQYVINRDYDFCKKISHKIIKYTLNTYYLQDIRDLKHWHIVNYLLHIVGKPKVILFGTNNNLKEWKNKFNKECININPITFKLVKPIFCKNVTGMTVFNKKDKILFLNADIGLWPRMLFTLLHELVHMYLGMNDKNYQFAATLCHDPNRIGKVYPKKLQNIEAITNTIVSLLYLPDVCIVKDLFCLSFPQIQAKYSMSTSALHNRLYNFFRHTCKWAHKKGLAATWAFRYEDETAMDYYKGVLGKNSRSVKVLHIKIKDTKNEKDNLLKRIMNYYD